MTLTLGRGPFGREPRGVFNFRRVGPAQVLYWEDCAWRVRCEFQGEAIADSVRVKMLHETGLPPIYYFPWSDVNRETLVPSEHATHCPYKGEASYWSIQVGERCVEDAAWSYPRPIEGAPHLAGYVAFVWSKLDRWWEEDREAFVHARDPYHRIDVLPSSRTVHVSLHGETLAKSDRPRILFETGLPPRYYLPPHDVRFEHLVRSSTVTRCPYKGQTTASWSFRSHLGEVQDVAWSYEHPFHDAGPVAGLVCFADEKVSLQVT